ncbi:hypothetical protein UWK_00807 [Desulfocapsa sulfexigens DSM 10523]|uniref:Uncharacterized protein n=1 Tax=Desulfocapsa sulfexigens (strain DSM 10523 / SB164P1) TaxID=1167006 RepID=M1P1K0_DESSD|nr:hypothetical protein [Desulfocapsa sulfexigens]AGF77383.1 hypothetical protein UWK_00807 [Desulfocapsa sulfexigens DSM 10523]
MQCERLIKQIKGWYFHVSNETMAPARMVSFIEKHAAECSICLADPDLQKEIERITEIILPESKIPKAVRMQQEQDELERRAADDDDEENDDEDDNDEDDDDIEDDEDDDDIIEDD